MCVRVCVYLDENKYLILEITFEFYECYMVDARVSFRHIIAGDVSLSTEANTNDLASLHLNYRLRDASFARPINDHKAHYTD